MPSEFIRACKHCPLCGSADYRLESPGYRCCLSCGHHGFNNPITAVAALILNSEGKLLLIRRAKDPAKGKLALPGGFVDAGETLEQAVSREITEEIGLTLRSVNYLASHPNDYCYHGLVRPVCDVFFLVQVDSFNVILEQKEVIGWEFQPLANIDPTELAFDSMRHALTILRGGMNSL
jgi:NAD+ diphosphatase